MLATTLGSTLSLVDFQAVPRPSPTPSAAERLLGWLLGKSRSRLAAGERELLNHAWPERRGRVLSLDFLRSGPQAHVARLRVVPDATLDTVVSVGALAEASDVEVMLAEIRRVLRPGGRFLFIEPVAAPAGTRARRLQGVFGRAWRLVAGSTNAPRDLWNDLKAARFGRLALQYVKVAGLARLPVPHLMGEGVLSAADDPAAAASPPRGRRPGVPGLTWREPAFAFFGA